MQGDQNQRHSARLSSITNYSKGNDEIYSSTFTLSRRNNGDQVAHIRNTHQFMVLQNKWLSETQFQQIYTLCHSLPGPTTTQLIITIITLKLKSISTAITCFLIYNIIPWSLLTLFGFLINNFLKNYQQEEFKLPTQLVIMGCTAAAAGIMVRSFYHYFKEQTGSVVKIVLVFGSGAIFYYFQSQNAVIFCLVMGAIVSLYLESGAPKKMSSKSKDLFSSLSFNFLLGKVSIFILISLFFILWIFFSVFSNSSYEYIFSFYWIGCFILGPIEVIFAYFISILVEYPTVHINQMWIGIALIFLVPGSHLNIGIYFGALIDGIRGALLAALFLYIPCFLFLLGMLPQWKYYRQKGGIKRIYQGLVCSTTGLTLSVIVLIMQHCMQLDVACSICIFLICAAVNCFLNHYSFMIIVMGGVLGFFRYLAVYCYRLGVHCPFPFNF